MSKEIDLAEYVTREQAAELNRCGYPQEEADYYWHWQLPDITKEARWEFLTKHEIHTRHHGKLKRCIAAPTKDEAVIWKLKATSQINCATGCITILI